MDFQLNAEQREIRDLARRFAEREISPRAAEADVAKTFPSRCTSARRNSACSASTCRRPWAAAASAASSWCSSPRPSAAAAWASAPRCA